MKKYLLIFTLGMTGMVFSNSLDAQDGPSYKLPPEEIIKLVDAPSTPSIYISPDGASIVLGENRGLPSLEEMAAEEVRLGGLRINPLTNGPSKESFHSGLEVMDVSGTLQKAVEGLPETPKINKLKWSSDGKYLAFLNTTDRGIELWVLEIASTRATKLSGAVVNNAIGDAYHWISNTHQLIYSIIDPARGNLPQKPKMASGPVIQENMGKKAASRTFQDLLKNPYDEALFEYFTVSQLKLVDVSGQQHDIVDKGILGSFSPSPDGKYILVSRIEKPFSYIVPFYRFPERIEVWDIEGKLIKVISEIPLTDNIPQGAGAVQKGPRNFDWRNDAPSTLCWVEALDEGDPAIKSEYRDQLFFLATPFTGAPTAGLKLNLRFSGIQWGTDQNAIITESWWKDRKQITSFFNPSDSSQSKRVIFDRSSEDRYNDPGRFITRINENGQSVLMFDKKGSKLFLSGNGASPKGNRPFVDEFEIRDLKTKRIWQSEDPYYEYLVRLLDPDKGVLITRMESQNQHPDYYLRELKKKKLSQITHLPDPSEGLKNISKQIVSYQREDGIPLSGTLYLPEGFRPGIDAPLPLILWAYPQEFKSADAAGQMNTSPNAYIRVGASSVVFYATQGYAVLDNASFPIVGEGETEPNDSFIDQLVLNASSAIDKMVEMKVADPSRVAVSGHSYGAFMTANLLSHCDLFAAGIARSGAYNRTLTPFGFQSEERTYWQSPEVYYKMSPFSYAHQMKTPLLLIHGIDDNNSGTFTMQSERYYDALRGQGATVRLVLLPHESHGYRARESVLHMHWETLQWLNLYVKDKK